MADIPLVDQGFYGNGINCYKEELKTVGVMFEYGEAYEFMGRHLMSLAAFSALTKSLSPVGSVLLDQEWKAASPISSIPSIDQDHSGKEILCFKM